MSLLSIFLGKDKKIMQETIEGFDSLAQTVNGFSTSINTAVTTAQQASLDIAAAVAAANTATLAAEAASAAAAHADIDAQSGITLATTAGTTAQTALTNAAAAVSAAATAETTATNAEAIAVAAQTAITTVTTIAAKAETDAQTAITNAATAQTTATAAETLATTAETTATTAETTAASAQTAATAAQTAATAAATAAAHAETDAQTAITNAATAQTTATAAATAAAHAETDAQTAITNAATAETNAQAALLAISQIEGINWNLVTTDTVLAVGDTALYSTATPVNLLPLHIATAINQVYEISIVNLNPFNGSSLALLLNANNATYTNQFIVTQLTTNVNNNKGLTESDNSYQGFFFNDVNGGVRPPFIRKITLFTGNPNTAKIANLLAGGGSSNNGFGITISTAIWNNLSTPYTSLGTLIFPSLSTTCNFIISIKRIS